MAITKLNHDYTNNSNLESVDTLFANRVVRVETLTETRNWSDTMDYTDYRSTNCTYALVWLGTHGVPPEVRHGRPMTYSTPCSWDKPRDLEFHEQFAWVDCTNLFSDRNGYSLNAEVDGTHGMYGEPLMWANLLAWEAYHKAAAKKQLEELRSAEEARKATEAAVAAEKAARQAKRDAKSAAMKDEAERLMTRIPAKGTTVTVDGFTGVIFWTGVSKYYGKWNARAGVKNSKGEVAWIPAEKF